MCWAHCVAINNILLQGFDKYTVGPERLGWLINMHPTVFKDHDSNVCKSGVDYYFLQADGKRFKVRNP